MQGTTAKTLAIVLAATGLAGLAGAATAAETIKFRSFSHIVGAQSMDPGTGVEGQLSGVAKAVGIGFLEDGRMVTLSYLVNYDFTQGAGPYTANVVLRFEDGSVLKLINRGTSVMEGPVQKFPDGKVEVVGGSGKYANAKGSGTSTGMRVLPLADGGDRYFDNVITLD